MTLLTREQILGACDRRFVEVECPEWGESGTVRVKLMTGAERDAFEQSARDARALGDFRLNWRARMLVFSAVKEDGEPLFTEADLEGLSKRAWTVLERVALAAAKLNATSDKQIEELEKN